MVELINVGCALKLRFSWPSQTPFIEDMDMILMGGPTTYARQMEKMCAYPPIARILAIARSEEKPVSIQLYAQQAKACLGFLVHKYRMGK